MTSLVTCSGLFPFASPTSEVFAVPRTSKRSARKSLYDVHPGVARIQDWLASLPQKTGKSLEEWLELVKESGPATEKERRDWLKKEHGLGTNAAWWIAERAEQGKASKTAIRMLTCKRLSSTLKPCLQVPRQHSGPSAMRSYASVAISERTSKSVRATWRAEVIVCGSSDAGRFSGPTGGAWYWRGAAVEG